MRVTCGRLVSRMSWLYGWVEVLVMTQLFNIVQSYACHECVVMRLRSLLWPGRGAHKSIHEKMSTRKCKGSSPCECVDFRSLGQKLRTAGKALTRKQEDAWKKQTRRAATPFSARLEAGIHDRAACGSLGWMTARRRARAQVGQTGG